MPDPRRAFQAMLLFTVFFFSGCEGRPPGAAAVSPHSPSAMGRNPAPPGPPAPPLFENFEGEPRLSLFPRVGDYRPENEDEVGLPFWRTYLEHLSRTSGVVQTPPPIPRGRVFSFRGVAALPSLGFFSPLAVEPETRYRIRALLKTELPEGASAGIGILEYDQFLWVAEQYPESLDSEHRTAAREGIRIAGPTDWREHAFEFTTGARTRMIHLVFFREGAVDRSPVFLDDIRVEKIGE